jgi:hypothetical protein
MAESTGRESMSASTKKITMVFTYIVLIVLLLAAFGFMLAYTAGDQLRLPFNL